MGGNRAGIAWIHPRRLVTIAGAYEYDSTTGRAANGLSASSAGGLAPMVNWSVVSDDWQNLQTNVRAKTEKSRTHAETAHRLKPEPPEVASLGAAGEAKSARAVAAISAPRDLDDTIGDHLPDGIRIDRAVQFAANRVKSFAHHLGGPSSNTARKLSSHNQSAGRCYWRSWCAAVAAYSVRHATLFRFLNERSNWRGWRKKPVSPRTT